MFQQIFISFVIFLLLLLLLFLTFLFPLLLLLLQSRERERAVTPKNFFLTSHRERKKILRFIIRFTHTHAHQKRSRREEEEEDKEEEVHPQNVSIWRRRQRKQSIVFVRSAIQSLPGLVHRPLGVGQRGQNHPTTERVGQIVATRRLGFPDVVQR